MSQVSQDTGGSPTTTTDEDKPNPSGNGGAPKATTNDAGQDRRETSDVIRVVAVAGPLLIGLLIALYLVFGAGGLIGRRGSLVVALGHLAAFLIPVVFGGYLFLYARDALDACNRWFRQRPYPAFLIAALLGFAVALSVQQVDFSRPNSEVIIDRFTESAAAIPAQAIAQIAGRAYDAAIVADAVQSGERDAAGVTGADAGDGERPGTAGDSGPENDSGGDAETDRSTGPGNTSPADRAPAETRTSATGDSPTDGQSADAPRPAATRGIPDRDRFVSAFADDIMRRLRADRQFRSQVLVRLTGFEASTRFAAIDEALEKIGDIVDPGAAERARQAVQLQPLPAVPGVDPEVQREIERSNRYWGLAASFVVGWCLSILVFVPDSVRRLVRPDSVAANETAAEEPPLAVYFGFVFGILIYLVGYASVYSAT